MNDTNYFQQKQFTNKEKHNLVLIAEKYMDMIENNKVDAKSLKEKILAWDLITEEFNKTASENGVRSVVEIKYLFDSLKSTARKVLRRKKMTDMITTYRTLDGVLSKKDSYCSSRRTCADLKNTTDSISMENNRDMKKETLNGSFDYLNSPINQKAITLCENCEAASRSSIKLDTASKLTTSKSHRSVRKKINLNKTTMSELEFWKLRKDIAHFQRDKAFFETQRAMLELKEKKMELKIKELMLNEKL